MNNLASIKKDNSGILIITKQLLFNGLKKPNQGSFLAALQAVLCAL
jgi:hypothetical protein